MKKLLLIMAHPDDAEMCCFGTIKKYCNKGYTCYIVIATDGENGTNQGNKAFDRIQETHNAFQDLPVHIERLGFQDGFVSYDLNLMNSICTTIKEINPEIIITHYPDEIGSEHQDHIAIGKAVTNCVFKYTSCTETFLYTEPLFSYWSSFRGNYFVDITPHYCDKINSLKLHQSQNNKFYMTEEFQNYRMSKIRSCINACEINDNRKYEIFQMLFGIY